MGRLALASPVGTCADQALFIFVRDPVAARLLRRIYPILPNLAAVCAAGDFKGQQQTQKQ
jgi:hypothetical protein